MVQRQFREEPIVQVGERWADVFQCLGGSSGVPVPAGTDVANEGNIMFSNTRGVWFLGHASRRFGIARASTFRTGGRRGCVVVINNNDFWFRGGSVRGR
jgi:hypothetical protein